MILLPWDRLDTDESREAISSLCHNHSGTALTIGGFDGPHIGHDALFFAVLENARDSNLVPGIVTFTRSPSFGKKPHVYPGDVSTLKLRLARFEEKGFAFALLIDFSGDFGKMSGGAFFDILVKTVCMRYVAVGPDFRCGHRLDTGVAEIAVLSRKEGFRFDSIRQIEQEGLRISSSAVRNAVQNADFPRAERLLGHPFLLDFSAPVWTQANDGFVANIGSFTQILPRRGMYNVIVASVSGVTVQGTLEIDTERVMLLPLQGSHFPERNSITTIRFWFS
jgi:riboflavin kinase/FMN adenylyltransferase